MRADWARITQLLDILAEAVTIRDREGSIAYANRVALASMGFASLEEVQARSSRSIMDEYIVHDERGNPLTLEDVPSVRLLRGDAAAPLVMRTIHRTTGEVSWRQLKTAALHDDDGSVFAAVTVIEDVTAVKLAETRTQILAESGRILAASLDYQETLRNVARLAVPDLADWCSVELVDSRLRREHVSVAHADPQKVRLAERLLEFEGQELDPERAVGRVLRSGHSELFTEINDEQLRLGARDAKHLKVLRSLEFRSVIVVPLRVPARTIGVMTLVTAESRRKLGDDDLALAEQLGRRAAVAVENARLHTTLARVADTLQQSLLPDPLPDVPGWEIASLYRPAGQAQRVDVGGDFHEVFPSPAGWFAVIGDVQGKGVSAAALTALLRHGARFASRYEAHPAAILAELDEALRSRSGASLCTVLCARLGADHVVISSAGHPPAMLATGGTVDEVPEPGPLLGAFPDATWTERTVPVSSGDMLLLYTDGVTETSGLVDRFGSGRLKELVAAHADSSPESLLFELESALDEFRRGLPSDDDIAALALRPAAS